MARGLGLQRNYFCLLAALLGNYLLTESDLRDFYAALVPNYDRQQVCCSQWLYITCLICVIEFDKVAKIISNANVGACIYAYMCIYAYVSDSFMAK